MHQVRSIIQYLTKGYSLRSISRELHMSRKTVTAYCQHLERHSGSLAALQAMDDASLCQVVYAPLTPPCDDERKADFLLQADYFLRELGD